MLYAMPPQTGNAYYMATSQYSNVQQSQSGETTAVSGSEQTADQMTKDAFPGSVMIDMSKDGGSHVFKAHIRDRDGHVKTVMFGQGEHISQTEDGDC